ANRLKLTAGLWLYDLLAGRQNIGRHRWLAKQDALTFAPALDSTGLRGAFLYYDCLTDDARLVIEVIKTAAQHGSVIANYASARGFNKTDGRISSIQIGDTLDHTSFELRAKVFVNATGVRSDDVYRLSDADGPKHHRPAEGNPCVTLAKKL